MEEPDFEGVAIKMVSVAQRTGTSYGQISETLNITWTGTLTAASIYVQTISSLTDIDLDDFSMTKP